jgi:hypothetical protein
MVLWKSSSYCAVLLRASSPAVLRTVSNTVASFNPHCSPSSSASPPQDEGDHDPDIDLITLRRRSVQQKEKISEQTTSTSDASKQTSPKQPSESSGDHPAKPIDNASAPKQNNESRASDPPEYVRTTGPYAQIDTPHLIRSTSQSKPTDDLSASETSRPAIEVDHTKHHSAGNTSKNLDPYLVHYLKSLRPDPASLPKRAAHKDRHRNHRDLDVDFLQPSDVRATYIKPTGKQSHPNRQHRVVDAPDVPPAGPESINELFVNAGIQHLNLTSMNGKVVIPRPVLVRLIEQTITLSGASVHGDDVAIERYSPTWHRFARLLRTSDLHKISSLAEPKRFKAKTPATKDVGRENQETDKSALGKAPEVEHAVVNDGDTTPAKSLPNSTPQSFTEREYVILALDTKKKHVSTSRFRRLLDGSANDTSPSSDTLLKVESLDRYSA